MSREKPEPAGLLFVRLLRELIRDGAGCSALDNPWRGDCQCRVAIQRAVPDLRGLSVSPSRLSVVASKLHGEWSSGLTCLQMMLGKSDVSSDPRLVVVGLRDPCKPAALMGMRCGSDG